MRLWVVNFNSIKVRLELIALKSGDISFPIFQFHKGTIRTLSQIAKALHEVDFNSIKVRLERCILSYLGFLNLISIP